MANQYPELHLKVTFKSTFCNFFLPEYKAMTDNAGDRSHSLT